MVDRIVPATRPEDLARVELQGGYRDDGVVVGEPFRQWVIEDDFNRPRPRWDLAGAEFVSDVEPYEFVKMRVLNACQTALSYLGALSGLGTTCDDAGDPLLRDFAHRMILDETAAVLPRVPSMEVGAYLRLTLARLGNPAIRHSNHQIATDGSQKINQRILQPLRDRMAKGLASPLLETAVAGLDRLSRPLAAGIRGGVGSERPADAFRGRHCTTIVRRHRRLHKALHRQSLDLRRQAGGGCGIHRPASLRPRSSCLLDGVAKSLGRAMAEAPPPA